ncbi:ceramidase [bacterium]|nr:ceramidase [bacterium]
MYWGYSDTTISFCELKYEKKYWIAEYYNTLSSFFYIAAILPFWRTKNITLVLSGLGIGVGSIILHGTGRFYGQYIDELSMLIFTHTLLKKYDPNTPNCLLYLIVFYLIYSENFFFFFGLFTFYNIRFFYLFQHKSYQMRIFILSIFCWLMDQLCIYPINFHIWWHFLTSISIYMLMLNIPQ